MLLLLLLLRDVLLLVLVEERLVSGTDVDVVVLLLREKIGQPVFELLVRVQVDRLL